MSAGRPAQDNISAEAVLALLKSRRSIRRYKPDPVPDEMIDQLLEAGRWAPSASNRQPWALIVVRDEAIRQQIAQDGGAYFLRWAHVAEAPLLIVLCGDARNRIYRQFLHEDVGLAGSQIMLQAKALGLGTCWIGGLDRRAVAGTLKVPDHIEIVGLLTVSPTSARGRLRATHSSAKVSSVCSFGSSAPHGSVVIARPRPHPSWTTSHGWVTARLAALVSKLKYGARTDECLSV